LAASLGLAMKMHQVLCFLTLVLTALGLAPGAAHVLEMPVKLGYAPELYAAVTSSLYLFFGWVGGPLQVAALVGACLLSWFSRGTGAFRFTLIGTMCLALSLAIWAAVVAPVNADWAEAVRGTPESIPGAYSALRSRWEYGHAAAFIAWFIGFCFLQLSLVRRPQFGEPAAA
jgi:hypothetical protein